MTAHRVLLTGASGFLGRYIASKYAGMALTTIGRGTGSTVPCDLATGVPTPPAVDLVIHAAGHAHTRPKTAAERHTFYAVNTNGTANLLAGLDRSAPPRAFVFISTVAVYGAERGWLIAETHPLDAREPYGASKVAAESLVTAWCAARGVRCAILRLPLLAGFAPRGNLGAMILGIQRGYYMNLNGGRAAKSMVLARDVAAILPRAAESGGTFNLTDGVHPTLAALAAVIASRTGKRAPWSLPYSVAVLLAPVGDASGGFIPFSRAALANLTSELTFDDTLARASLNWRPNPVLAGEWVVAPDV